MSGDHTGSPLCLGSLLFKRQASLDDVFYHCLPFNYPKPERQRNISIDFHLCTRSSQSREKNIISPCSALFLLPVGLPSLYLIYYIFCLAEFISALPKTLLPLLPAETDTHEKPSNCLCFWYIMELIHRKYLLKLLHPQGHIGDETGALGYRALVTEQPNSLEDQPDNGAGAPRLTYTCGRPSPRSGAGAVQGQGQGLSVGNGASVRTAAWWVQGPHTEERSGLSRDHGARERRTTQTSTPTHEIRACGSHQPHTLSSQKAFTPDTWGMQIMGAGGCGEEAEERVACVHWFSCVLRHMGPSGGCFMRTMY